jgi:glycosyltransferase involved in cell wall biosynthesis
MKQLLPENIVSVVIPAYNRADTLFKVLEGLAKQSAFDSILEIIVIDDGSTQNLEETIAKVRPKIGKKLIFEKQIHSGLAAALNNGMMRSQGDIILFLGDDMVPSVDLVKEHISFRFQHDPDDIAAVVGYSPWHPAIKMTPFLEFAHDEGWQANFSKIDNPCDIDIFRAYITNISYPRKFLEAGGELFDNDLSYYWIDSEFAYRLTKRGLKIMFNKDALAYHLDRRSFFSFWRRMDGVGYFSVMYFRKHRELRTPLNIDVANEYPWWRKIRALFLLPIGVLLDKFSSRRHKWVWDEVLWYSCARGVRRYFKEYPMSSWAKTLLPYASWNRNQNKN